jgi:hypothetical protein
MPRLDDEFVRSLHVAKNEHLEISRFGFRINLPHTWHPTSDHSVVSFGGCLGADFRKELIRMVGPCVPVGINHHVVIAMLGPYKRVPSISRKSPVFRPCGSLRRCRRFHLFRIGVSIREKPVCEQVRTGHTDVFDLQPQKGRIYFCKCSLGALGENSSTTLR